MKFSQIYRKIIKIRILLSLSKMYSFSRELPNIEISISLILGGKGKKGTVLLCHYVSG